jgi:hypothetical protein
MALVVRVRPLVFDLYRFSRIGRGFGLGARQQVEKKMTPIYGGTKMFAKNNQEILVKRP